MSADDDRTERDGRRDDRTGTGEGDAPDQSSGSIEEPVERVAASTVRLALLVLGIVILLFATGQLIGVDVLAILSDALDTREARWFTVAFFGLLLITIALRGFRARV